MNWKQERDSLIAETMAFVQSVAGRKKDNGFPNGGRSPAILPVESAVLTALEALSAPNVASPSEPAKPVEPPSFMPAPEPRSIVAGEADEIRARIAGFRAHQERFNRERDEYFSRTLAKLKAEINQMPPPRVGK